MDQDALRYEAWLEDVIENEQLAEPSVRERLRLFVDCVRAGSMVSDELLALVADGVERHLDRKVRAPKSKPIDPWPERSRGRPARKEPLESAQVNEAFIKFHRKMLPMFDGRAARTQTELADFMGIDEREVRKYEKLSPPLLFNTAFDAEISRLIRMYKLPVVHVAGELYPASVAMEWLDRDYEIIQGLEKIRALEAEIERYQAQMEEAHGKTGE